MNFFLLFLIAGNYRIQIEARDGLGSGPHSDLAEIKIEIQSINQHRPIFIMPALSNATVEIPEVSVLYSFALYPSFVLHHLPHTEREKFLGKSKICFAFAHLQEMKLPGIAGCCCYL